MESVRRWTSWLNKNSFEIDQFKEYWLWKAHCQSKTVVIHQALNKGVWTWKILYSTYRDGNFPLTPVQWLEASFQPFSLYIVAAKAWAVFHTQDANERIILISVDWWTPFTGQLVMRHDLITERSGWCGKRLHRQLKLKSKQLYRHHVTQKIQTSWWQARVNCYSFLSR